MAPQSCSVGSCGNGLPVPLRTRRQVVADDTAQLDSGGRARRRVAAPWRLRASARICSKSSCGSAEHDVAVHLDEAAIGSPGRSAVVRAARARPDDRVVEAEVEDRVHHARHGDAARPSGPRPAAGRPVAEALAAHAPPGARGAARTSAPAVGVGLAGVLVMQVQASVVIVKPGRHRNPQAAHLGQARPLAAQEVLLARRRPRPFPRRTQ